jgi:peptidyl-prolyl cis-trans isomerase C
MLKSLLFKPDTGLNYLRRLCLCLAAVVFISNASKAAAPLFDDPIIAKGKNLEVRQSQLDDAFTAFKAAKAAGGERVLPNEEGKIKTQILNKLVSSQLLLSKANLADKKSGEDLGNKLIQDSISKAPSEAAFKRQLLALGTNLEKYRSEVIEEATVKSVIDRELGKQAVITEEEILKFYNENPKFFEEPEGVRVRHILFAMRTLPEGAPLDKKAQAAKKELAQKVLIRAREGADFTKLVAQYSDDTESRKVDGVLAFRKGSNRVPGTFEAASFSLEPGKISDLVSSTFGLHIIKLEEKLPAKKEDFAKVHDKIKESIFKTKIQKVLPDYIVELKKAAGVEFIGFKPE